MICGGTSGATFGTSRMNEVLTPILARVTRGTELLPEEIEAALGEILEGRVADVQAAGFIVALRTKGESFGRGIFAESAYS